ERTGVNGQQQERQPVCDDCETGERRRLELAEDDPVADDVLDVVGHHRAGKAEKETSIARMTKRGKRARINRGMLRGHVGTLNRRRAVELLTGRRSRRSRPAGESRALRAQRGHRSGSTPRLGGSSEKRAFARLFATPGLL